MRSCYFRTDTVRPLHHHLYLDWIGFVTGGDSPPTSMNVKIETQGMDQLELGLLCPKPRNVDVSDVFFY